MWIKITPKHSQNEKVEQHEKKLHALGVLSTEQLHVNVSDISTVAFGEGITQIRLSSGKTLDLDVAEEIALLKRHVEGEDLSTYKTIRERLPDIMRRAAMETAMETMASIAEDHTATEAKKTQGDENSS